MQFRSKLLILAARLVDKMFALLSRRYILGLIEYFDQSLPPFVRCWVHGDE